MLHKFVDSNSVCLLKVRLVFLLSAFVHLLVTAFVTLTIDTTVDNDPRVRAYYYVRWKLLTCWFNLITLAYLPIALYCNWRMKEGDGTKARRWKEASDFMMTSLIFPVTVFSDLMFWSMYTTDPALLGPIKIFEYLPYWTQHSLHTVSLVVVILDLILTPRTQPASSTTRITLLMAFIAIYNAMAYSNYRRGEFVYPVCERMNDYHFLGIFFISLLAILVLYKLQWVLARLVWGTKVENMHRKDK